MGSNKATVGWDKYCPAMLQSGHRRKPRRLHQGLARRPSVGRAGSAGGHRLTENARTKLKHLYPLLQLNQATTSVRAATGVPKPPGIRLIPPSVLNGHTCYITGSEFVVGDEVGATYRIENIGNTPAILQKSSTEIRCLPALLISPNYSTQRTWGDRIVYSREAIAGMRCTVPKSEKTVLGATGFTSYFYGYFVYLDVFGKFRRTGFCYAFDGDKSFSRVGGPAYNYDIEIF